MCVCVCVCVYMCVCVYTVFTVFTVFELIVILPDKRMLLLCCFASHVRIGWDGKWPDDALHACWLKVLPAVPGCDPRRRRFRDVKLQQDSPRCQWSREVVVREPGDAATGPQGPHGFQGLVRLSQSTRNLIEFENKSFEASKLARDCAVYRISYIVQLTLHISFFMNESMDEKQSEQ